MAKIDNYFLYIIFGVLPSIIWLSYYLRKDVHPEPKRKIIKIFFYGMLAAAVILFPELKIIEVFGKLNLNPLLTILLSTFIAIAFIEELAKYLVVRLTVFKSSEFDEPTDAMVYMIISALGFAALENILVLFSLGPTFMIGQTMWVSAFRFVGATFLHTLCSGMIGFSLALSLFKVKKRMRFFGLAGAVLLHGLYNLSIVNPELVYRPLTAIMKVEGIIKFVLPIIILIGLAMFVFWGFRYLRRMKSICKI